jgi:septal ring factor EnvC (AmiA/AmiB activator)
LKYRTNTRVSIELGWKCLILSLLLLLGTAPQLAAQSQRKHLEDKRKNLLKEIDKTEKLLRETKKEQAATLDQYSALRNKIQQRQQLIRTLQEEIAFADASIERTQGVLELLEEDARRLRDEYAGMLRRAYRHKLSHTRLAFLLSANSINDFYLRWQYLRQYERYRRRQAQVILETRTTLAEKATLLAERREEKEQLLAAQQNQRGLLDIELKDKERIISSLKSSEQRHVAELERQRKLHEQLNTAIEDIIREEMDRRRREARGPEGLTSPNTDVEPLSGLSQAFMLARGQLPSPVERGQIVREFGVQPHPTIKSVQISNNGIDILARPRSEVYAVFEGRVAGTQFIPGYQHMVIIEHGQFYTVYSNLEEVYVKKGDKTSAKQAIGRLNSAKPEVHFEIWREKQRLNPSQWIRLN